MSRAEKIILRKTARGLVPASGWDAELLDGLPIDCDIEAKRTRVGRSKAMAAWWIFCKRVADCLDEHQTAENICDILMLDLNQVKAIRAIGSEHRVPRNIRDFTDEQIWNLRESAIRHVSEQWLPGIDMEKLLERRR